MCAEILYVVSQSPEEGFREEFNDWYNNEHIPELLECPGFLSARRFEIIEGTGSAPAYLAMYEVASMDAFSSEPYLRQLSRSIDEMTALARTATTHRVIHFTAKYRQLDLDPEGNSRG